MKPPKLIVCEQSNRWTVALRWSLSDILVQVVETHKCEDACKLLTAFPSSVMVLELEGKLQVGISDWLGEFGSRYPTACWIAAGRDRTVLWLARQLGAAHAVSSTRDLRPTIGLVRRHLQRIDERPPGLRERVWSQMPWA